MNKNIRFRLIISIPVILFSFTVSSGLLAINLIKYYCFVTPTGKEMLVVTGSIISFSIVAGLAGILLAFSITRPLEKLTLNTRKMIMEIDGEYNDTLVSNEVDALSKILDKALLSINNYVKDVHIIDSLPEGIIIFDSQKKIVSVNRTAASFFNCEPQQLIDIHINEIIPQQEENKRFYYYIESEWKCNKEYFLEIDIFFKGKKVGNYLVESSWVRRQGKSQLIVYLKDPKVLKSIRKNIRMVDQLAIVGTMASGIAHEVRNPLGALHAYTELIARDMSADDPKRIFIKHMLSDIDRLNNLVDDVLDYSQNPTYQMNNVNLCELLEHVISTGRQRYPDKDIKIINALQADTPSIQADSERLIQAFVNIVNNAIEATPDGGVIEVRCQVSTPGNIVVTITDNGPGITDQDLARIFVPFHTTKAKGTGLGLTITQNIIDAHGGNIDVTSDTSKGTTFSVYLPIGKGSGERRLKSLKNTLTC